MYVYIYPVCVYVCMHVVTKQAGYSEHCTIEMNSIEEMEVTAHLVLCIYSSYYGYMGICCR